MQSKLDDGEGEFEYFSSKSCPEDMLEDDCTRCVVKRNIKGTRPVLFKNESDWSMRRMGVVLSLQL